MDGPEQIQPGKILNVWIDKRYIDFDDGNRQWNGLYYCRVKLHLTLIASEAQLNQ